MTNNFISPNENSIEKPENALNKTNGNNNRKKRIGAVLLLVCAAVLLFIVTMAKLISLADRLDGLEERISMLEELDSEDDISDENEPAEEVMLYHDNTYGDIFVAPLDGVPLNDYDWSGLELDERNRYTYYENGKLISKTGIDVSYHQDEIDWESVAADGIDFAMIRIGYRGYEQGIMHCDELADSYIRGATEAGIDVGVYFYSQAVSEEEAREEAVFACELIKDYDIKYPVVFDWELPEDKGARTLGTTAAALNKCAEAFCSEVRERGYNAMLYSNLKMALTKYDMRSLSEYDFWYVEYKDGHNPPQYPYELAMWQYASDGQVNGIGGYVDMNISFVDYAAEKNTDEQGE